MTSSTQPVAPDNPSAIENAQSPEQIAQSPGVVTGATKIASIGDLKEKAPEIYKALLMAIAMRIRSDQESSMKRFKEEQRKMRG